MTIEIVEGYPYLKTAKELFREYADSLEIDLVFQGFEEELKALPGKYALPWGRLYVAYVGGQIAGCIALRSLEEGINRCCEMKRLYVRPAYRGLGIGRLLGEKLIQEAKSIGYKGMYLDTLSTMTSAIELYRTLGFEETEPYCFNPVKGARYLKLDLRS